MALAQAARLYGINELPRRQAAMKYADEVTVTLAAHGITVADPAALSTLAGEAERAKIPAAEYAAMLLEGLREEEDAPLRARAALLEYETRYRDALLDPGHPLHELATRDWARLIEARAATEA